MDELIKKLKEHLPPLFAGTELDKLTGNALRWRSIQNLRANRELPENRKIPKECFVRYNGKKVLINRDPFLDWWMNQLTMDTE
ncbi:MAG: hypothetical protein ACNI27_14235 [Desulfovibrio sp.]